MAFIELPKPLFGKGLIRKECISQTTINRILLNDKGILTSQFVEDQVLKLINKFDVLLSMTSFWILTINCERVDQSVRSNNTKEIHFFVLVLKSCKSSGV